MRVTTNTYTDTLAAHLQNISKRHTALQAQIASGQRVQSAEEDPVAVGQVLKLRDQSIAGAQYQKNIQTHQEFASATHGVLRSLTRILNRAQEIAFRADGLESREDLQSYAAEVSQLIQQAVQSANAKHRGEYLLSGTRTGTAPFAATLDAEGRVSAVTFAGNNNLPESEIAPGASLSSRIAGAASGAGPRGLLQDSRHDADLFAHLISLQNQLLSGDVAGIQETTRQQLQADEENVLFHVADNAALQTRLEGSLSQAKQEKLRVEGEISRRVDVDLPEAILRMTQAQTSYQAALQSGGPILNLSLLDYIR